MVHYFALFPKIENWATNRYDGQQIGNKHKKKRAKGQQKRI
jgi:hypothetical protein